VPPYLPPVLEGNRLAGRGACDAKGIAAAMMAAADRLVESGEERVDLLFVVGEEKGSDGARAANQLPATSRFLINGEPSAIEPLLELLPTVSRLPLPTDPILGDTTVNIGVIRGGTEANIIPASAEAELMFRLVGDVGPLRALLEEWAKGRAELEYGSHIPAQRFHTIPGFDVAPMAYTTDIPLLGNWGTPLLFGPGSIHVAHTPDEYVDIRELRSSVDGYERLVRTLLAS
jgi:acetylornithine deacetylase